MELKLLERKTNALELQELIIILINDLYFFRVLVHFQEKMIRQLNKKKNRKYDLCHFL